MLKVGDKAPAFTAHDALGNELGLETLLQSGPLVLIFRRYVGCPICRQRFADLGEHYDRYKRLGAQVYAVVGGAPARTAEFMHSRKLPNVFLVDPRRELYDLFQVGPGQLRHFLSLGTIVSASKAVIKGRMQGMPEGNPYQLPADFIVRQDGSLALAHYGEHFGDSLNDAQLLDRLSML
ncbi:MAG: peroxiredoxin-like family protein [Candidatus Alcyoniella australis]|nr:peroxiredoxin-like family protein [Candidatus Alcyoniella australis]